MNYYFFDADVWLNLMKDDEFDYFKGIKDRLDSEILSFLIPKQLELEIKRNYDKVINQRQTSINTYLKHVKILCDTIGLKEGVIDIIDKQTNIYKMDIENQKNKFSKLFWDVVNHKNNIVLSQDDSIVIAASRRALEKKAPFHKSKNSMGDAIHIESIFKFAEDHKDNYEHIFFVTLNKTDFSGLDERIIHPDLKTRADNLKISYSIDISSVIQQILSIQLPEKETERLNKRLPFDIISDKIQFCDQCYGDVGYLGYKNIHGFVGHLYKCSVCNKEFLDIDGDY